MPHLVPCNKTIYLPKCSPSNSAIHLGCLGIALGTDLEFVWESCVFFYKVVCFESYLDLSGGGREGERSRKERTERKLAVI